MGFLGFQGQREFLGSQGQWATRDQTRSSCKSKFLGFLRKCTPKEEIPGRGAPERNSTSWHARAAACVRTLPIHLPTLCLRIGGQGFVIFYDNVFSFRPVDIDFSKHPPSHEAHAASLAAPGIPSDPATQYFPFDRGTAREQEAHGRFRAISRRCVWVSGCEVWVWGSASRDLGLVVRV